MIRDEPPAVLAAPDSDPAASDRSASNRSTSWTVAIIGAITCGVSRWRLLPWLTPGADRSAGQAGCGEADPRLYNGFAPVAQAQVTDSLVAADVGESDNDRTIRAECGEDT